jgi:phage gpG-like protein
VSDAFEFIDDNIRAQIRARIESLKSPERLWNAVGERLASSIDENFEVGGRPNRWAAVKLETRLMAAGLRSKAQLFGKRGGVRASDLKKVALKKILVMSGRLRRSISYFFQGLLFMIGSNLVYARIHQLGGMTGSRYHPFYMKPRPYLVIQEEDKKGITQIDVPRWLEISVAIVLILLILSKNAVIPEVA